MNIPGTGIPVEIWRAIENVNAHQGHYEVSNHGRVRHCYDTGEPRILKALRRNVKGQGRLDHMVVNLCGKNHKIAKLVWEAFKGPRPEGTGIIHINGVKSENAIWNLKCIRKEEIGKMYGGTTEKKDRPRRTIVRIDRDGNILNVYRSCRAAEREYGCLSRQSILNRCNRKIGKKNDYLPDGTTFRWEENLRRKRGKKHEQGDQSVYDIEGT